QPIVHLGEAVADGAVHPDMNPRSILSVDPREPELMADPMAEGARSRTVCLQVADQPQQHPTLTCGERIRIVSQLQDVWLDVGIVESRQVNDPHALLSRRLTTNLRAAPAAENQPQCYQKALAAAGVRCSARSGDLFGHRSTVLILH